MTTLKAFTFIELIVGMAVIAVLITLGLGGISILQQNARDTERTNTLSSIANLINDGKVLGLFIGRTEYGPRALGNRSIIVKPTEKETHENLNTKLKRTEIMPFAPSVLNDYSKVVFQTYKSEYTSEFMTLCYTTNPNWVHKLPAVIQELDSSARPQIVKKESNSIYYNIIDFG